MKKTKYYAWMMAAALAMTGCSDEIDTGGGTPTIIEGATGYAKVTINLPTALGTRAYNDDFDDGSDSEYAVNSGIIVYFTPAADGVEANATFAGAYNLPLGDWNKYHSDGDTQTGDGQYNGDGPITTETTVTAQAPLVEGVDQLHALVILNPNNIFNLDNNDHSLTINATTVTELSVGGSTTFSTVQDLIAGGSTKSFNVIEEYTKDGFMMLNAPLASTNATDASTNTTVSIMPKLTIYTDATTAANSGAATEIFMERVMAKVTISGFKDDDASKGKLYMDISTDDTNKPYFTLQSWGLDVTNKYTYLVHNVTGSNTWFGYKTTTEIATATEAPNRFISNNEHDPHRIYWSMDPNYNGSNYGAETVIRSSVQYRDQFNYVQGKDEESGAIIENAGVIWRGDEENEIVQGDNAPIYCLENTFNTANMDEDQTTRILFKGIYNIPGEEQGASFFTLESQNKTTTYTVSQFKEEINKVVPGFSDDWDEPAPTVLGGKYETVGDLAELLGMNAETDADDLENIQAAFGSIKYYKNGETYYHIQRIEHFGDELAYWDKEKKEVYTEEKHLGRYGVVRNNWYEINVNSISGPGEPNVPDTPDNPDDDDAGFVNFTIKILSWAKRAQSVDL